MISITTCVCKIDSTSWGRGLQGKQQAQLAAPLSGAWTMQPTWTHCLDTRCVGSGIVLWLCCLLGGGAGRCLDTRCVLAHGGGAVGVSVRLKTRCTVPHCARTHST
jgi:hypothetical protein